MQLEVSTITKWWNKLWRLQLNVELDSTQITIHKNNKKSELMLSDIELFEVNSGWLFSSFIIRVQGKDAITVKGFKSQSLQAFKREFIQALLKLVSSSARWKEYIASIERYECQDSYLSSYEWQPIAELHYLITKLTNLGVDVELLENELHKQAFEKGKQLSKQDVSELGRELHNQNVVPRLLSRYDHFFDTVEKLPLTDKQREACVTNDDHNLVIAGAGTGKTATLVGKAGFLVEANIAKAKNVLLLAFGNEAAKEMNNRIKERIPTLAQDFKASTFHALGNEIVAKHLGYKKKVTPFSDQESKFTKFINDVIEQLIQNDHNYKALLVNYFSSMGTPAKSELDFDNIEDYHEFLSSCRLITLKGEWVKSVGELRLANYLALQGVEYQYEADYCYSTKSVSRRQYQPDFYLPQSGIYIEYLGLDENQQTAPFVDQKSYLEDLNWKRELHKSKDTKMIELYSYQLKNGCLQRELQKALEENNVSLTPIPLESILEELRAETASHWHGFIELVKRFLGLFKEGCYTFECLQNEIRPDCCDVERTSAFISLFEPIYLSYQEHLEQSDAVDFSDMIALAVDIIESGKFYHTYNHILVDEFQDISGGRARLLNALLKSKPNMRLFAVGDDWQSIYRFNGADIGLFTEFKKHFSPATYVPLDKTFRFNNRIHSVSSQFVMANPVQIKKQISTHSQVEAAATRLVDIKNDYTQHGTGSVKERKQKAYLKVLHRSLNTFDRSAQKKQKRMSVLIIGRYRQENMMMLKGFNFKKPGYEHLDIKYVTAHASKGLEADYVIVLGVDSGCFPSAKESDELIDLVLPKKEQYLYAEERRLFYVALTRAKHFIYVIFDSDQVSPFLTEIAKYGKQFIDSKQAGKFDQWSCPSCNSGTLIELKSRYGKSFYKCSFSPACNIMLNSCKACNAPLLVHPEGFRHCMECGEIEIGCQRCGIGTMVARKSNQRSNYETFYGCNRFRRGADDSCRENIREDEFKRRKVKAEKILGK